MSKFDSLEIIKILKTARLPSLPIYTQYYNEEAHRREIIGLDALGCLEAIEEEIKELKKYKKMDYQVETLQDEIKHLTEKKTKIEREIEKKENKLKEPHDELLDFLKARGLDTVDKLKSFFERYDEDKRYEMNRQLDEYYHGGR